MHLRLALVFLASLQATGIVAKLTESEPKFDQEESLEDEWFEETEKPSEHQNRFIIENEVSGEFLYVDKETSGSYSADVFTAPISEIRKSRNRFMTFTLYPVGDAYQIDCPDANLTLIMVTPLSSRGVSGVALKAERRDLPDDLGLWYMPVSPNVATRIYNKKSSYYLYAYRFGWHRQRHTVVAAQSKDGSFAANSFWYIKEEPL